MKILAIGDPHGNLDKIKKMPLQDIDLILLTGDLGSANLMRNMFFENIKQTRQHLPLKIYTASSRKKAFMEAYTSTIKLVRYLSRFAPVYIVFGNVESSNKDTREQSKKIGLSLPFLYDDLKSIRRVKVLNNIAVNFAGIRIGGLGYFLDNTWVKTFDASDVDNLKESKNQTQKVKRILGKFGRLDILLCHQPPHGILDKINFPDAPKSWQGKHAGSKAILDYIKKAQPSFVFCGHIHEAQGIKRVGKTEVYNLGNAGYQVIGL